MIANLISKTFIRNAATVGVGALIVVTLLNAQKISIFIHQQANQTPMEIAQIKATNVLDDQVKLYQRLIERVGPEQAQEELLKSGLPFTGQTHLLNHTVGEYIYKEFGTGGLTKCRDYFLSSCYHGFVMHVIAHGGLDEVRGVMEACRQNGNSVFAQCAHAVGHGLLAWSGYKNLPSALAKCDQLADNVDQLPLFSCHDGAFMENVWGIHDGEPSPDRWVNAKDNFFPCNSALIAKQYRVACWSNQPALLYQRSQRDIAWVGTVCQQVTDPSERNMCFNGLARQIHPVARGDAEQSIKLCDLLPKDRVDKCIADVAFAAFSVGDRKLPLILCAKIPLALGRNCTDNISKMMKTTSGGSR